jgi:glycosyltransferase involved in cell wall biosynthesis
VRIRYFADIRFPMERANGVQTMETCHALARRGHDVRLLVRPDRFTPGRDPYAYYGLPPLPHLHIEQVATPSQVTVRRLMYIGQAMRLTFGARDTDVVLTRDLGLASMLVGLPPRWRPPIVYESHGFAPAVSAEMPQLHAGAPPSGQAKQRRLDARERRVWRRADAYVTITAGLARELEGHYGPRPRLAVIADGTRLPIAPTADGTAPPGGAPETRRDPQAPPVVCYAGHLYPWKGIDLLVEALGAMPHVRGLVVGGLDGEGDFARVKALADRVAPNRVTFAGMVDPPRVAALLSSADILVIPNLPSRISAAYTSPLKLFEYMASGRPIVASDLPALREVLRPDHNAVLVEPGRTETLVAGIQRIVDDPAWGARLATAARTDVADYSWEKRAERLEAALTAAMEARS